MTAAPRFGRLGALPLPQPGAETVTALLAGGAARIEGIASLAHATPPGQWYDQPGDEFVLLVAGSTALDFADAPRQELRPGDWAVLPAHCRHRVAWTDPVAPTLWLAVHLAQ